jgi:Flp pilus assembly protein TadD
VRGDLLGRARGSGSRTRRVAANHLSRALPVAVDVEVAGVGRPGIGGLKTHFQQENYGHAARYFERAVEVNPGNAEAWLGLAASYDRIRRFDLADRAYRKAGEFIGHRAEYFNNVGYSYLLRGDVVKARDALLEAYRLDPDNLAVRNNLALLRESVRRANRD